VNVRRKPPVETRGAERNVVPTRLSWAARKEQHAYAALSSLGRLIARPGGTLLTLLVLALALLLPLLLATTLRNVAQLEASIGASSDLMAFLDPARGAADAEAEAKALRALPGIAKVELRTPEQGLAELKRLAGFGPALALLPDNPLPFVLTVTPRDDAESAALAKTIAARPGVDLVRDDAGWRARLRAIAALARRLAAVAAALFGLGALLVVGNTIRVDVAGRRDEIQVMQVVGATPAFVRRPFLYAGLWYGLAAALIALAGAAAVFVALAPAVASVSASYGAGFALQGPGWAGVIGTPAAGIVLGWLGARVAVAFELARGARAG